MWPGPHLHKREEPVILIITVQVQHPLRKVSMLPNKDPEVWPQGDPRSLDIQVRQTLEGLHVAMKAHMQALSEHVQALHVRVQENIQHFSSQMPGHA